jgi:GTP-binding protein
MSSPLLQSQFATSALSPDQFPADSEVEVAFCGRSNAGKSSAINALVGQKGLARTSRTPGRTQRINYFRVTDGRYLVDLPGYGYAKVPLAMKQNWERYLASYLHDSASLRGVVLVMDVRHPLTPPDSQLASWCGEMARPLHILLTKSDKLGYGAARNVLLKTSQSLARIAPAATLQLYSSQTRLGIEEARAVVDGWLVG